MRRSLFIAVLLAIAAGAWIASGYLSEGGAKPTVKKPPVELDEDQGALPVRVRTQRAEPRVIELLVNGQTEADRRVDVKAEISGPIAELPVEKGSKVAAGDVLARIADQDRSAVLEEAKALLMQRRIELDAANRLSERGYRAETQRAASEASFEAAEATVRRAEVQVEKLTIRSPFDGILDDRMVESGDYVESGDSIARVVDLDPILLVAQVSERDVASLELGAPGSARLVHGEKVWGHISFIARAADPVTRTFRVELEVENADLTIRDGITTELRLPVRQVPAHLVSPAILTLSDDGLVGVQTVNADDRVVFRPVTIIEQAAEGVWLADLPEETTFVTVGQEFVTDGQSVQPIDEAAILIETPEAGQ